MDKQNYSGGKVIKKGKVFKTYIIMSDPAKKEKAALFRLFECGAL